MLWLPLYKDAALPLDTNTLPLTSFPSSKDRHASAARGNFRQDVLSSRQQESAEVRRDSSSDSP